MIFVLLGQTNVYMQIVRFVRAFYCADGSQAIPALVYSNKMTVIDIAVFKLTLANSTMWDADVSPTHF